MRNNRLREGELFTPEDFGEERIYNETDMTAERHDLDILFMRLDKSDFRRRFRLRQKDLDYIKEKGMPAIRRHAEDFVSKRLAAADIPNDGRQTPMKGHPVFIAQHATGCCCRGCMEKWHGITKGRKLTTSEQKYIVDVLTEWIIRQIKSH